MSYLMSSLTSAPRLRRLEPQQRRAAPVVAWLRRAPAYVFLGVSSCVAVASLLVSNTLAAAVLHDAVGLMGAVAILAGALLYRPQPSWPWFTLAAGTASFALGDVAYNLLALKSGIPAFSAGDVLYLTASPLFAASLVGFASGRFGSTRAARLLYVDSVAVFLAAFLALWFLALDSRFDQPQSAWSRFLLLAFPVLDLVLLALLARLVLVSAHRLPAYRFLVAAVASGFLGDLLWRAIDPGATSVAVTLAYYGSYVLLGAAAIDPSMRRLGRLETVDETRAGTGRLLLLGVAILSPALVLALSHRRVGSDDAILFSVLMTGVTAAVSYRLIEIARAAATLAERARRAAARMSAVLQASPLPIAVLDARGRVEVWNDAAERVTGWERESVLGGPAPVVAAADEEAVERLRRRTLAGDPSEGVEVRLRTRQGEPRDIAIWTAPVTDSVPGDGQPPGAVVAVFADVTEERLRDAEMERLAHQDHLTGLPNRRSFQQRLAAALAAPDTAKTALVLIDVDNFKLVNDAAGHLLGDRVLSELGRLFRTSIRDDDYCARLSGDEFALLLSVDSVEQAQQLAQRLLHASRSYRLVEGDYALDVTVSIGIALLEPDLRAEQALSRADSALYEAKEQGRNRAVTWDDDLISDRRLVSGRGWSARINDALREGRFLVHLQPIVELASGRPVYHEALVRMLDEHGDVLQPAAFLPHAIQLGLIEAIDRHTLDTALALLRAEPQLRVFVNLDQASFRNEALLDHVTTTLRDEPNLIGRLGIEITERTFIRDYHRARQQLGALAGAGCTIAIDDFGSGFSSFEHLRELPADFVKVGNGFVHGIESDPAADQLLRAVVLAAGALGKRVIAEGVETAAIADRIAGAGVSHAQGYHYGRPAPPASAVVAVSAA
jgi:diguanylate cyclase (GGDEF)-like protein/PAS domain S-box-containing protein